jgi:hypothetical protein
MKGPDAEIFKICKNSAGYPESQSDGRSFEASRYSGRGIPGQYILKVAAGLLCMAILSLVTLQTVFWSTLSEPPAYGLPLVLIVSLISVTGIVVSRSWRLRVGK